MRHPCSTRRGFLGGLLGLLGLGAVRRAAPRDEPQGEFLVVCPDGQTRRATAADAKAERPEVLWELETPTGSLACLRVPGGYRLSHVAGWSSEWLSEPPRALFEGWPPARRAGVAEALASVAA